MLNILAMMFFWVPFRAKDEILLNLTGCCSGVCYHHGTLSFELGLS